MIEHEPPVCRVCGRPWIRVLEYPIGYVVDCECEDLDPDDAVAPGPRERR